MKNLFTSFVFIIPFIITAQVLPVKEQAKLIDEIREERIAQLIPQLMTKNNIDCWIVTSREYNEDPIMKTLLPATSFAARRRTILVFYYNFKTKTYKTFAVARYNLGNSFEARWDMKKFPDQWDALIDILQEYKPEKIALNFSDDFSHADGLHYSEYNDIVSKLSPQDKKKIISSGNLAIEWLETRTQREMEIYPTLIDITHKIIKKGFSRQVITPGFTTADDLEWWFRQELVNMGLNTWFHPSVHIQKKDSQQFNHLSAFSHTANLSPVMQAGDLIHVDFGISYLGLHSDIQEHAYILKPNETEPPAELAQAFTKTNRLQDILTSNFKEGLTGNEILKRSLEQASKENIKASIYTHPLGLHGHAAGPTIGLWDKQDGVPGSGDYPLKPNTCYSIELNASHFLPSWQKEIRIMLEQNGFFNEKGFRYIQSRQTALHIL